MNPCSTPARALVAAAVAGSALVLASNAVPGPNAAAAQPTSVRAARTAVTFEVADCGGCRVRLQERDGSDVFRTPWKGVRDGEVTFRVARARTQGVSVVVDAPWEGDTGYDTTVVFRYAGQRAGDPVSFREARDAERGSGCWAGAGRDRAVTVPLVVRKVRVDGVQGRVDGSIAYAPTTEDWALPMQRTPGGVLGSQDVIDCVQGG